MFSLKNLPEKIGISNRSYITIDGIVAPYTMGGCRLKTEIGNFYIKIDSTPEVVSQHGSIMDLDPTGTKGNLYAQTKNEIALLSQIEEEDLKYFPKVYKHGIFKDNAGVEHYWLIEEKIDIGLAYWQVTPEQKEKLEKIAKKYHLEGDVYHNWGINRKTGEPCIYDWGINAA